MCVKEQMTPKDVLSGRLFDGKTVGKGGECFCFREFIHIGQARPSGENAQRLTATFTAISAEKTVFFQAS
jgi:hypothetical protein